jgi:hypothetical protein
LYQLAPSAVIMPDGELVAMYATGGVAGDGTALGIARMDAVGRATIDVPFRSARAHHADPWLARDATTLYAVWRAFDADRANEQIALATSTNAGRSWSTPIAVHQAFTRRAIARIGATASVPRWSSSVRTPRSAARGSCTCCTRPRACGCARRATLRRSVRR